MKLSYSLVIILAFCNVYAAPQATKISLKKGETNHLELPSNRTTGYSWYPSKEIPKNAPIAITKSGYEADDTGLVGSGGNQYWDIKGIKKGNCTLILEYKRPWEKNVKPVDVRKFMFQVK